MFSTTCRHWQVRILSYDSVGKIGPRARMKAQAVGFFLAKRLLLIQTFALSDAQEA
jgi:hypothetical protein